MKKYKVSINEDCDDDMSLSFRSEDGIYKNQSGLSIHIVTKKEPAITTFYPSNIVGEYRLVIEDLVKENNKKLELI